MSKKKNTIHFPILKSIGIVLFFLLCSAAVSLLFNWLNPDWYGENYFTQLVEEMLIFAIMLILRATAGLSGPLHSYTPCRSSLLTALPLACIYGISVVQIYLAECQEMDPAPISDIIFFILAMLAIGAAEELTFRGIITKQIYLAYGNNRAGFYFTVLISGILFGCAHLINAIGADIGGVLVQVAGAASLGMCLSAIYLRSGNLFITILLHAFMDFCALFDTAVFPVTSMVDTINSYDSTTLYAALFYTFYAFFLMRPSKTKKLTPEKSSASDIVRLMVGVGSYTALLAAVFVMILP